MRLIDAERLKRTFRASVPPVAQDFVEGFCVIVDNVSTVDAVEVVRCKDCRWWERDYQPRYYPDERPCNIAGMGTSPDWYCADGEKRDE